FNAIQPGGYTLRVNTTAQSTDGLGLAQGYSSHFLAISDFSAQVALNFTNGRANALAKTYSYNLTITNNGPTPLLAPFYLTFDALQPNGAQVVSGTGPNAQGSWWLAVGSSIPGGRLNAGQTSTVMVITFYDPSGLKMAFKSGLLALPAPNA